MVENAVWPVTIAFWLGPAVAILLVPSGRIAFSIGIVWLAVIVAAWIWLVAIELPARSAEGSDLGPTVFAIVAVVTVPAVAALVVASVVKVLMLAWKRATPPSPSA